MWVDMCRISAIHALMLYYHHLKLKDLIKWKFGTFSAHCFVTVLHPALLTHHRKIFFSSPVISHFFVSLKTHLFKKYLTLCPLHWIKPTFSLLYTNLFLFKNPPCASFASVCTVFIFPLETGTEPDDGVKGDAGLGDNNCADVFL